MNLSKNNQQPAWPFPQKRFYVHSKVEPQPKALYPDKFSKSVFPATWQSSWLKKLSLKKAA